MWTLVHEFQLQASDEETGKSTGPSDALVLSRPLALVCVCVRVCRSRKGLRL
jgi:hypothetical protein